MLIVENEGFLLNDGETDPDGQAVALVKIRKCREFAEEDVAAACATRRQAGFYSWELYDVRRVSVPQKVRAERGLYTIELNVSLIPDSAAANPDDTS